MDKLCKTCRVAQPIINFVKSTYVKTGYRSICKSCFNAYYRKRRVEKYDLVRSYEKKFHKQRRLKFEYNLTEAQFEELKQKFDNRCAICNSTQKLVIDHNHTSGKVRGLLCSKCNLGLGHFKDDISNLKEAIKYLNNYDG